MVKVTFTLDDQTVARLRQTSGRLGKPQSAVVREAIAEYAARAGRLSDAERRQLLQAFDGLMSKIPSRPARLTDAELQSIRDARRAGGRRHRS